MIVHIVMFKFKDSTFDSKEDLQAYAVHPEHLKVVELIKRVTLESKVVDYTI